MYRRYFKRLLDVIFAVILLVASFPFIVIIAILIILDDGMPVIFKQKRFGHNRNPFTIYKFRTMKKHAPSDCPTNSLENHEKYILRVGRIIRKLSLDELPQLLNVVFGEMSIVGPRPVILQETDLIEEREKYKANACKPGITGWAQVNGRDEVHIKKKAKMDGEYAKRIGFVTDLKCILMTLWAVISVKGHKEGVINFDMKELSFGNKDNARKVLFTSHTANFQKFNRPFMRWFKEQGYIVHYASAGEEEVKDCDQHFTIPFERSPFKISNIKAIFKLKKILDEEKYDIIHTHTPMGSVVTRLAAIKTRKENNTRVLYTAHGFHFYKGAPILNWLVYYPIEKFMARFTDTLITINKEDYNRAKRKFSTRVEYVPGVGVDPNKFNFKMSEAEKQKLRKSLGLKKDDFVMIYPAELNKNKNQKFLIEVMKKIAKEHPNIHLLLPGQDSMNGFHENLIKNNHLENNVHLLGYRKDIPQLMKISNLAVSASKREGLPVNIIESIYSGLSVIATDCRGHRDLIRDGVNGYVCKTIDENEWISRILSFYNNSEVKNDISIDKATPANQYCASSVLKNMSGIYHRGSTKPIRVLQIVTIMNRGGLETMLMNYYRNIDRDKIQFDFLVHRQEKGAYDDEIEKLGGKIYRIYPINFKNIWKYRRCLKDFFVEHPEYHIVHSHLDALSALPLSVAKKCRVNTRIAHSHSDSFDKNAKYLLRQILKRLIKCYATDLFGCSESAIKSMFGKKATNYTVVNNAIDLKSFAYDPDRRKKVRKDLGLNDDCLVIGHVGRFNYPKNHDFLVDIYSEIYKKDTNSMLLLVGNGSSKEKIEQKVKKLGLKNKVKFLGVRSDVPDLMQAMDIFVMPSLYEGLPLVAIEAQASGLQCFFSDVITNEISVTDNCYFVSLNKRPYEWSKRIRNIQVVNRQDKFRLIKKTGYDISSESSKMLKYYTDRCDVVE